MFINNNKKYFPTFLYFLCVVALAILVYQLAKENTSIENVYEHVNLMTKAGDSRGRSVMREDAGTFLFVAGSPDTRSGELVFHRTADIRFTASSLYQGPSCTEAGKYKARLIVSSPPNSVRKRLNKPVIEFTIKAIAGDTLKVKLDNPVEPQCGQATLSLHRINNTSPVLLFAGYLSVWVVIGLLLARAHLGYLGLWGAAIHGWYLYSEVLHRQALDLAMGTAFLLSLTGIGVLLIPFISRYTRLLAPAALILVTVLLVCFPLANLGNYWLTGSVIDADAIYAIFQTHPAEAVQFLAENYSAVRLVMVFGSIALCSGLLAWKLMKTAAVPPLAGPGIVIIILAVLSADRMFEDLLTLSVWRDASIRYSQELKAFQKVAEKRQVESTNHELRRVPGKRVTVLIIGESHSKRHMSLYGYLRDTTPKLVQRYKAGNLVVFENAYSNHTHTMLSLTLALTEANQYNQESWTNTPSLINIPGVAGIRTYWISNQQMLGLWSNAVSLLARDADEVIWTNKKIGSLKKPYKHDEAVVPHFLNKLREPGEKLIVVHLMGSHGGYCIRFPEVWKIFSGDLDPAAFGNISNAAKPRGVNCYDNSIQYNDHILDVIFNSLEESEIPASALYFADHSEEVLKGKAHNSANFEYSMSEIPLVFAASDSWRKEFPEHWEWLVNNRKKIFTNDLIFETVLGLMGIESDTVNVNNDLGHQNYKSVEAPKTLHGRVSIKDDDNYYLWQRSNADRVIKNNLGKRLLPHRVNTLGKMYEIAAAGLRSFEVDVLFRPEGGYFEVGHDAKAMTGLTLESFLEKVPPDIEKIWLDIKKVDEKTVPGIIKRLIGLDNRFELKDRVIVETTSTSSSIRLLSDHGFHVSYYLPHKEMRSAIRGKDQKASKLLAKKLGDITKSQDVSAVSFNLGLYGFVKDYLEPELAPHIVYHTWSPPGISFKNSDMLEEIQTRDYFHDSKVETILLTYVSPFSL